MKKEEACGDIDPRFWIDYYLVPEDAIPPADSAEGGMKHNQMYNPLFSLFWNRPGDDDYYGLNGIEEYRRIALNHRYHVISAEQGTVYDCESKTIVHRDVFVKYSPLLDPFKYMVGKYKPVDDPKLRTLPMFPTIEPAVPSPSQAATTHPKMANAMNSSYVDCFFYYLSSMLLHKHGFVHGIDFYGSYLGIQDEFRMNIEEDIEYLADSSFFMANIGKLMALEHCEHTDFASSDDMEESHQEKPKLTLLPLVADLMLDTLPPWEDIVTDRITNDADMATNLVELLDPVVDIDDLTTEKEVEEAEAEAVDEADEVDTEEEDEDTTETEEDTEEDENIEEEDAKLDGRRSSIDIDSDADDDSSTSTSPSSTSSSYDEDAPSPVARVFRFPVQAIHLERCTGTLDELFDRNEINPEQTQSAFFQIIMILLVYQRAFKFTHNDLHTNNIMYIDTDIPYLWYHFQGVTYRVPTYGRLYKIIDYGRSIYRFRGQIFCSDSFAPGGDGATQYNCEPFLNPNKPRLEPNMSFDLCRLGCSIYDFLWEEEDDDDDDKKKGENHELKETIKRWCTSDSGVNMLYKPSGSERFPGFKLYKMIARMVNKHTPEAQLSHAWFQTFVVADDSGEVPADNEPYMNLHAIPTYYQA